LRAGSPLDASQALTQNSGQSLAEASYDALVTTDQSLRYQQNITGRKLAILVLSTTSWPRIQQSLPRVVEAINALGPGDFVEITID
jgi:hypothetical protein